MGGEGRQKGGAVRPVQEIQHPPQQGAAHHRVPAHIGVIEQVGLSHAGFSQIEGQLPRDGPLRYRCLRPLRQEELFARLAACAEKDRDTALRLLEVYLKSLD